MKFISLSHLFFTSILTNKFVHSCVQTVPATTPSTTTLTPCQSCPTTTPTFDAAGQVGTEIRTTPIVTTPTTNSAGCIEEQVECSADTGGFAFIVFNGDIGGPCPDTPGASCFVTLVCDSNMDWTFTADGLTTVVTEVTCLSLG